MPDLRAQMASEAIEELANALTEQFGEKNAMALQAVLEREATASTGLGDQVAVPHASIEGLQKPLMALGVSRLGVDFNSVDGRPANVIFLLLMPPRQYEEEVRILAGIARAVIAEASREKLLRAATLEEALVILGAEPSAARPPRSRRASLADI